MKTGKGGGIENREPDLVFITDEHFPFFITNVGSLELVDGSLPNLPLHWKVTSIQDVNTGTGNRGSART